MPPGANRRMTLLGLLKVLSRSIIACKGGWAARGCDRVRLGLELRSILRGMGPIDSAGAGAHRFSAEQDRSTLRWMGLIDISAERDRSILRGRAHIGAPLRDLGFGCYCLAGLANTLTNGGNCIF